MSIVRLPVSEPAFDPTRAYVRFRELRADGLVRFDFALGDPELAVELALPRVAYDAFCREWHVHSVTAAQARAVDREQSKWRYGVPGFEEE